tara:strand:+ start:2977 stop:3678 length:702 start_codon:yes stop_codon:yes gene_type:complete
MFRVLFFCGVLSPLSFYLAGDNLNKDDNGTEAGSTAEVIRVIQPGVFDLKSTDFLIRMRAWGVGFPKRGEPGFEQALSFTEKHLLSTSPQIIIRQEFDTKNLKVCEVKVANGSMNFSREAITLGIGWHLEDETGRFGPYLLAQLKAKRMNLGVWANDYNYAQQVGKVLTPSPQFPNLLHGGKGGFVPRLNFWVSSFGKIHRPECSFYERGRGMLTTQPKGIDCRICGGRNSKK